MTNPLHLNNKEAAEIHANHVEHSVPRIAAKSCRKGLHSGVHDLHMTPYILQPVDRSAGQLTSLTCCFDSDSPFERSMHHSASLS